MPDPFSKCIIDAAKIFLGKIMGVLMPLIVIIFDGNFIYEL